MTLEELKLAMENALKASQAASSDKKLQLAYEQAKTAYDEAVVAAEAEEPNPEEDPQVDPDESKLDEKTKAYLAKLRKENANHRTKAKDLASKLTKSEEQKKAILKAAGIEIEDEDPATMAEKFKVESQQHAFSSAILRSAVEHGIGKDELEFFEFLVSKGVSALEEDEELSEEAMAAIVAKVKKAPKGANTSVGKKDKDGNPIGNPNPDPKAGEVTLAKFITMSISEKSKLYETNLELYTSLIAQAKAQRKLV